MTAPLPYGYVGQVRHVDPLSHRLVMVLARPTGDGYIAYPTLGGAAGEQVHVPDGQNIPDEALLRIPFDQAEALWRLLCHHFGDGPPGEYARADLLHERGRVDRLIDALIAPPPPIQTTVARPEMRNP